MIDWFGYFKALHLIFMVSWFAGLFYMVRLFVYYTESDSNHHENANVFRSQYLLMQKRLWTIIAWPAMIFTLIVIYHLLCHLIYLKQKNNTSKFTSLQLRIWNEVATLFLVAIIFIIVLKNQLDGLYGTIGFILFGLILFIAVKWYKKIRNPN